MANYVWRGISGQQGDVYYFNPAAWTVNGAATTKPPGPGDTATIDQSSPGIPLFAVPGAATGDTISGQTINFSIAGSTRYVVARFNGTDLDTSATVNSTGPSQVRFDGSGRWKGVVNVGTPAGPADAEVILGGGTTATGSAYELLNTGTVNVTNGSRLSLVAPSAVTGSLDFVLINPSSTRFQVETTAPSRCRGAARSSTPARTERSPGRARMPTPSSTTGRFGSGAARDRPTRSG